MALETARTQDDEIYDTAHLPPPFVRELTELVRYRDLVVQFVSRDLRTRYKRSLLGFAWTMLNPLLMLIVFTVVFSNLFRPDLPRYPLYLLSAQLLWNFFAQSTTLAINHLAWGGPLVTKIYLPRSSFAVSQVGSGLVNLAFALVPLVLIMLGTQAPLTASLLWLPVAATLAAAFALGVALFISAIAVGFQDVVEMYQVILTAWYFLTPIVYPISIVPHEYQLIVTANPMYYIIETFRAPIYRGVAPDMSTLITAVAWSAVTLLVGRFVFTLKSNGIPVR